MIFTRFTGVPKGGRGKIIPLGPEGSPSEGKNKRKTEAKRGKSCENIKISTNSHFLMCFQCFSGKFSNVLVASPHVPPKSCLPELYPCYPHNSANFT